ncbi:hypothetical protein AgCh_033504 [Apium graveolens]
MLGAFGFRTINMMAPYFINHRGEEDEGDTVCTSMVSTVFEAEALAILEGLQWLLSMNHTRVTIESDSMLAVRAL